MARQALIHIPFRLSRLSTHPPRPIPPAWPETDRVQVPTAATGRATKGAPMNTITDCTQLLDLAADHLAVAARHAEANACGDLTLAWHSLAGQIRLVAGGVAPIYDDAEPVTSR